MDNILEILVPLIVAGVYFFGNMLSNKSDEDESPNAAPRTADEEADAIERQRRIQAEIRRKIMERRREGESSGEGERPVSQPSEPAVRPAQPSVSSTETWQSEQPDPDPEPSVYQRPTSHPYQDAMQAQLQQIEATKRQAERLKRQVKVSAKGALTGTASRASQSSRRSGTTRRPIRSTLQDPAAVRSALIYAEILGPPVSQRKSQSVPGLS